MTLKLGSRLTAHGQHFEVVSIRRDGGFTTRRLKDSNCLGETRFAMGERVRIVGVDQDGDLAGEVVSLAPIRAKVVTPGVFFGVAAGVDKLRKAQR